MVEGNGGTAPQEGVLEEITRRLAAITPEQFITPELTREPDAHFVCMATDSIKRLFTLRSILVEEHNALLEERARVSKDALKRVMTVGLCKTNEALAIGGSPESVARDTLDRLTDESRRKKLLHKIIDNMCWYEVGNQHRDLRKNDACVFSDWSLCWKETDTDIDTFRPLDIGGITPELGRELQRVLLHRPF